MTEEYVYVVGDRFINFSGNNKVYTYTQVINLLNNEKVGDIKFLVLGQGLNDQEKKILLIIAKYSDILVINGSDFNLVGKGLSHKHKIENRMITEPVKEAGSHVYTSNLFIDDNCSEMNDHVTGQHIQGMALTEAARQMMLAVAEKYLLDDHAKGNSYCVLLNVNSSYIQFAFPIATKIVHKVEMLTKSNFDRYQSKTITEFYQSNNCVAKINIDYVFNNRDFILMKESKLAFNILNEDIRSKSGHQIMNVA